MKRAVAAAYWAVPSLFCLAIYWLGLKAWFQQDDFAWLSLNLRLHEEGNLLNLLFEPKSFGTIRPLSERTFFLVFHGLFGLNALPFRITVFVTQFANLALISSIARRLTRSRAVGFWAPLLFAANGILATVMTWTSAYNQALCAFFLLASFRFLLLYIESGKTRYWVWQWVTFLLGFGALETNIVYPAVAASYTFLLARKHFRKTLWLFLPSGVYAALHWHYARQAASGPYRLHYDASMLKTLWTYWQWDLSPARLGMASIALPSWMPLAATLLLTLLLAGFTLIQLRKKNWLAAFLLLWFIFLVAPYLPLRDHLTDYYATLPAICLALLGAWALVDAWEGRWPAKLVAGVAAVVYLACSLPVARAQTRWYYERSQIVRTLVRGLARAHELHPDKAVLLTGVTSEQFWGAIFDKAYRVVGIKELYLAPGSEEAIQSYDDIRRVSDYVLPAAPTLRALEAGRAVVYDVGQGRPRNVTSLFRATAHARFGQMEQPRRVDAGSPLFADQLGPTWYPIEGGYRWMPKRATVVLGGSRTPGDQLYLSGYCPARQVEKRPLTMSVSVDGVSAGSTQLPRPDSAFEVAFRLPPEAVGKPRVEVTVEVDRTFVTAADNRELGLVFGTFAIR